MIIHLAGDRRHVIYSPNPKIGDGVSLIFQGIQESSLMSLIAVGIYIGCVVKPRFVWWNENSWFAKRFRDTTHSTQY